MSVTELQERREALGLPPEGPDRPVDNGRSIAERAGDEPEASETSEASEPEELFVLEQGRRVTVSQLVARGIPIEYRVTMNSKSLKGGGDMGLLSYKDPDILLVVPARQGKVVHDPTYSEEGDVTKVTIRVNFKPLTAHDATSREGRALLGLEES